MIKGTASYPQQMQLCKKVGCFFISWNIVQHIVKLKFPFMSDVLVVIQKLTPTIKISLKHTSIDDTTAPR